MRQGLTGAGEGERRFVVELIKPSHYDNDGYVIQWARSWLPSDSFACLYALTEDTAARRALGDNVGIETHAYDERHTVLPIKRIVRRIRGVARRGSPAAAAAPAPTATRR